MTLNWFDYLILGFIAVALVVDLVVARFGEPDTISFRIARWARLWPIIPFLAGVLCGHLFWPNHGYCP